VLAVEYANSPNALALAFTGKAASVLRAKGARRVATIHSYLFGPLWSTLTDDLSWRPREEYEDADLLVIDETSQIDATLGRRLVKHSDVAIVAFGDSFQIELQPAGSTSTVPRRRRTKASPPASPKFAGVEARDPDPRRESSACRC